MGFSWSKETDGVYGNKNIRNGWNYPRKHWHKGAKGYFCRRWSKNIQTFFSKELGESCIFALTIFCSKGLHR